MSGLLLGALKRRIEAAVAALILLALLAALGLVALGAFAFAIYHHFRPEVGAAAAWWISGGIFLVLSAFVGGILFWRLKRGSSLPPHQVEPEPQSDTALKLAALLRDELPRNAVPATVLALIAGIAVGMNPEVFRAIAGDLSRKRGGS